MEKLLAKLLNPVLDRIPKKWKTAIGLLALTAVATAFSAGWIDSDLADELKNWSVVLFGVGVFHKMTSDKT